MPCVYLPGPAPAVTVANTSSPFILPTVLVDNYVQTVACMWSMEKRLIMQGNLEDFSKNFKDTIDRGVYSSYTSPVNYFTVTYAFKPDSMNPIRICTNSNMEQPGKVCHLITF